MGEPDTEHRRPISYLVRSETRLTKLLVAHQAKLVLPFSWTTSALVCKKIIDNLKKKSKEIETGGKFMDLFADDTDVCESKKQI